MATYLQPVTLPQRCFLHELLLWVAVQRMPIAQYNEETEIRESDDVADYAVDISPPLFEEETQRLGIPIDPDFLASMQGNFHSPPSLFAKLLAGDLEETDRKEVETRRDEALKHEAACASWQTQYQRAIEFPTSRIFVALRSGDLKAKGRQLPSSDRDEAFEMLEANNRGLHEIEPTEIPVSFWSLQGIDFTASAAKNETAHYCHISFQMEDVLSVFPGERQPVSGVERVGDSFVLNNSSTISHKSSARGRPPYPWDAFHLEVAGMVRRDELPAKKEAAIAQLQTWFQHELGICPSRAAVGEKLKPYYEKFVKPLQGRK